MRKQIVAGLDSGLISPFEDELSQSAFPSDAYTPKIVVHDMANCLPSVAGVATHFGEDSVVQEAPTTPLQDMHVVRLLHGQTLLVCTAPDGLYVCCPESKEQATITPYTNQTHFVLLDYSAYMATLEYNETPLQDHLENFLTSFIEDYLQPRLLATNPAGLYSVRLFAFSDDSDSLASLWNKGTITNNYIAADMDPALAWIPTLDVGVYAQYNLDNPFQSVYDWFHLEQFEEVEPVLWLFTGDLTGYHEWEVEPEAENPIKQDLIADAEKWLAKMPNLSVRVVYFGANSSETGLPANVQRLASRPQDEVWYYREMQPADTQELWSYILADGKTNEVPVTANEHLRFRYVYGLVDGGFDWEKVAFAPMGSPNPWAMWTWAVLKNKLYYYQQGLGYIVELSSKSPTEVYVGFHSVYGVISPANVYKWEIEAQHDSREGYKTASVTISTVGLPITIFNLDKAHKVYDANKQWDLYAGAYMGMGGKTLVDFKLGVPIDSHCELGRPLYNARETFDPDSSYPHEIVPTADGTGYSYDGVNGGVLDIGMGFNVNLPIILEYGNPASMKFLVKVVPKAVAYAAGGVAAPYMSFSNQTSQTAKIYQLGYKAGSWGVDRSTLPLQYPMQPDTAYYFLVNLDTLVGGELTNITPLSKVRIYLGRVDAAGTADVPFDFYCRLISINQLTYMPTKCTAVQFLGRADNTTFVPQADGSLLSKDVPTGPHTFIFNPMVIDEGLSLELSVTFTQAALSGPNKCVLTYYAGGGLQYYMPSTINPQIWVAVANTSVPYGIPAVGVPVTLLRAAPVFMESVEPRITIAGFPQGSSSHNSDVIVQARVNYYDTADPATMLATPGIVLGNGEVLLDLSIVGNGKDGEFEATVDYETGLLTFGGFRMPTANFTEVDISYRYFSQPENLITETLLVTNDMDTNDIVASILDYLEVVFGGSVINYTVEQECYGRIKYTFTISYADFFNDNPYLTTNLTYIPDPAP